MQSDLACNKKIWIDLDNSPHVPFFVPIIERLKECGYQVTLTARDCFQVCALADYYNLNYKNIGRHYGRNKILKLAGLILRALQLMPTILKEKPNLALSHGSRSQFLVTKILGIHSMLITDYEHAKALSKILHPDWMVIPKIIPDESISLKKDRILKYPGIKEDVYVPNFNPDPRIREKLGLTSEDLVVTVRPPATQAHYHNPQSEELFDAVINFLCEKQNARIIVVPRDEKQRDFIKNKWPERCSNGKIIILGEVVDGLNLIWFSDLVISGGGTMNREAAALGVPVYSIFRGKIGAVDRYLADNGRLVLLESVDDISKKVKLLRHPLRYKQKYDNNPTLERILENVIAVVENRVNNRNNGQQ